MDSDSESKLKSLISQLRSPKNTTSENVSCIIQIITLVISIDLESQPKPESELMSLVTQTISVFNSMDLDSQPEPMRELISLISQMISPVNSIDSDSDPTMESEFILLFSRTLKFKPRPELMSIIFQINSLFPSTEPEPEPESESESELMLISVISKISPLMDSMAEEPDSELRPEGIAKIISFVSVISELISLVSSLDLGSQPNPGWGITSLIYRLMAVASSITESEPEYEFISLFGSLVYNIRAPDMDLEQLPPLHIKMLIHALTQRLCSMDNDSDLQTLIARIFDFSAFTKSKLQRQWGQGQLSSLSPQLKVQLVQGKFHVTGKFKRISKERGKCHLVSRLKVYLGKGKEATHFRCLDCNGEDHEECEKTPSKVKQPLHPKHYLQLVVQRSLETQTRKCYCCEDDLQNIFYYCSPCDYAMNIACAEKPPVLSIKHPRWHKHTLALFPRQAFLTCNVCALADENSPIYMCPSCDFVVHQKCLDLPRVIRISRHPHRLSFTPSFDQGDWSCGICRRKIDNDYGSYSCIRDGCSYAAHSKCATQRNVWDGKDLEGEPEEIEEEVDDPFVRISDGIIQHFSHQHHHLRLDENTARDYDDNKLCQACITPIYFGNFYSCIVCDFIIHEKCAKLSRKIFHPIHPHILTLVGGCDNVMAYEDNCSACPWSCIAGFFYKCNDEKCRSFKLHVQCATIAEPLVHKSHRHPLFLTSKPGEQRACSVCKDSRLGCTNETFNCIEECKFSLCFKCATIPQKVRYKHDRHMLTLSYGEETSTMKFWCEVCEESINPKERFYMCDECCVTLHIECLIGKDLYMKPGLSCVYGRDEKLDVLPNSHMSRPFCLYCRKRCRYKTVVLYDKVIRCSTFCIPSFLV